MKKIINEFKEFAIKGNMFDMAVGMIIGSAFTGLVKSIVETLINPLISIVTGNTVDFSEHVLTINGVNILYGQFVTGLINFFITAFVVFLLVKMMNNIRNLGKKEEPVAEKTPKEPEISSTDKLLMEILEEIKKQK